MPVAQLFQRQDIEHVEETRLLACQKADGTQTALGVGGAA
jgi:hypothetical protein